MGPLRGGVLEKPLHSKEPNSSVETFFDVLSEALLLRASNGQTMPASTTLRGMEQMFTAAECATYLRLDNSTVTAYCRSGALRASKVGRRWLVAQSALVGFANKLAMPKATPAFSPSVDEEAARILQQLRKR